MTGTRELTEYITLQLTEGKLLNSQEVREPKSLSDCPERTFYFL